MSPPGLKRQEQIFADPNLKTPHGLLCPKRLHRTDPSGPPRRDQRRRHAGPQQGNPSHAKAYGIGWGNAEQKPVSMTVSNCTEITGEIVHSG